MDLLPVAPHARPPVFRLGDANEAARQARLRERDSRKKEMENRRKTSMKEVGRCLPHAPLSYSGPPVHTHFAASARAMLLVCCSELEITQPYGRGGCSHLYAINP